MLLKRDMKNYVILRTPCSVFPEIQCKFQPVRFFHRTGETFQKKRNEKNLMVFEDFSRATNRNRNTFLEMVR